MKSDNWFIHVHSQTHDEGGKKRSYTWKIPQWMRRGITAEKFTLPQLIAQNLPSLFHGCEVTITTPLHVNCGVVDPDSKEFAYIA